MTENEQQSRIKVLELQVAELMVTVEKMKIEAIPLTKEVIGWHVHGSNGKIYWELPEKLKKEQEKILRQAFKGNYKNQPPHMKSNLEKPDDDLKITIME